MPHSAVLFLRRRASTPDSLKVRIATPGGSVEYEVQVMKAQQYTLEKIFEKNLLFLIPFYIFSHESQFGEYEKDKAKLRVLQEDYGQIKRTLEALSLQGFISEYITPAVKYRSVLLAQTPICCVVINCCSTRYSSIFRLAYEDLFCVIYCDI